MANPALITVTANAWTKVATAVQIGQIWNKSQGKQLSHTYRVTAAAAPTNLSDAMPLPIDQVIPISSAELIDVYIYNHSDENGTVRVDLP